MFLFAKKRSRLSLVALQTQRLLLGFCFAFAIFLGSLQLFLMNYVHMQGYVFTKENEKSMEIAQIINQLDAQIAKAQSRDFISKTPQSKEMIVQPSPQFFIKEE